MRKVIFFIAFITLSILTISCSNKQIEQPILNNISSQVNSNTETQQLTPTPIIINDKDNDDTVQNEEEFYGQWIIKNVVAFCKVGTYDEDDIKNIVGQNLSFSKEQSSCFGDDISYLKDTVKNPIYKKSLITSDDFMTDFYTSLSSIGINTNTVAEIEIKDANNCPSCLFYIKDDNSLVLYGGGTFFELSRVTQDPSVVDITPTLIATSNDSNLNNTTGSYDKVSEDSNNKSVDNYLCCENEDVLFSFNIADSEKSVSICISKDQQDYIIYRYGTKDKIELEYPIKAENSWSLFTYSYFLRGGGTGNEGLDLNYLSFDNGGYTYKIYEEYGSESDKPVIGIKVTNQETNEEKDILGDSNSIKGTLISLRDNTKINIAE